MLNRDKLHGRMRERKYTIEKLADLLGINPATMHRKMNGESDFTRSEIQLIRSALALTNDETEAIFFAQDLAYT